MDVIEYGNNWFIEDQLDNELLNDIKNFFDKNLEFLYNDKEGYSTTGHNAEQYWIKKKGNNEFLYKNKEYEDIERRFREGIHGRLKAASFLKTNNTQGDGFIDGISVVLYLNVPDSEDSKDSSNSICLVLHTDPSSNFLNKSCPSVYHIKPEVGKVLIFPYNIPHGTYPQTKGIRQTFNIDYWFSTKSESTLNYS